MKSSTSVQTYLRRFPSMSIEKSIKIWLSRHPELAPDGLAYDMPQREWRKRTSARSAGATQPRKIFTQPDPGGEQ